MIHKIDIGIDEIKEIFHLADIHIRSLKRHTEYRQVFKRTYKSITDKLTPNSVIYVAGDIVHNKLDLSPECVDLTQEFFRNLADIAPTIVIAGNHDCNLNNTSRQDSIEPIVNALRHPNLYYLKESGIYQMGGVEFVVMSVWESPENFIKSTDCTPGAFKIALHHGAVNKAQNDIGYTITNDHVTVDRFKGYDLTLLGDIHKFQYLNNEKTIAYASSLIQQNHGESIDNHGYLVWELPSKKSTYVEVPNDYGYVTINVTNGKIIETTDIPKKPRIRLKIENTSAADIKKILSIVKQKYNVQDVSLQRINSVSSDENETKISLGDIHDTEYQNELITRYVEQKYIGLADKILDRVRHINRMTNSKLESTKQPKNIIWKPKKFEFDNMFSYGDGNSIDFTNMKGTYGLFAPNASGKSAMLDALTYCIFDKCSRSTKGTHVLNNKKNSYWCKFNFEIKGIDYYIERTGTKQNNGTVKVLVDFYRIIDGSKESLNGEQRDDTNKEIRSYLGQYEDFVLTALSLQNNNTGFIDMPQRHRKDLLSKFLDIGVFEELYQIANKEISEVSVILKKLKREDFSTQLAVTANEIQKSEISLKQLIEDLEVVKKSLDNESDKLTDALKEFITINTNFTDIKELLSQQTEIETLINNLKTSLEQDNETINSNKTKLKELVLPNNIDKIESDYNQLIELNKTLTELNNDIDKLELSIQHKESKLENLEEHEYDPNCEYCVNNVFVKDAIETEKQLKQDNLVMNIKLGEQEKLWEQINALSDIEQTFENIKVVSNEIQTLQIQNEKLINNCKLNRAKLESTKKDLTTNQKQQQEYHKNKESIEHNKTIQQKVDDLKQNIETIKQKINTASNEILLHNGEYQVLLKTKQNILAKIQELSELEIEYEAYEKYLNAVKRDGVPYELISTALPRIEQEVNNILTQMTDFTIMFNTDGKNINAYIVYDEENFWLLELTSGMEKFISSLAIRNALISISNLPRPSFLAIDEGLGNLDGSMLSQMFLMLDYLKSQFDFLILISHIDATRDMVDTQISINKVNGFSQISHS